MTNHTSPERATVTRKEAAQVLGIGIATLDRLIKAGALPVIKLDRRVLIPRKWLQAQLDSGGELGWVTSTSFGVAADQPGAA